MASPIFSSAAKAKEPIMLDSILGYIWMREHSHIKNTSEVREENLIFPELPIKRTNKCYHASALIFSKYTSSWQDRFTKRGLSELDFKDSMKTFVAGTNSAMKPGFVDYVGIATPTLTAYVDVTDVEEFKRLTNQILHFGIGAKTSIGFGRVKKIDYESYPEDKMYELMIDGRPTRALPVQNFMKMNPKAAVGYTTYYAPYWFAAHKAPCFLVDPEVIYPFNQPISDEEADKLWNDVYLYLHPDDADDSDEDDDDDDEE